MRSEIITAVQALLASTGVFSMVCGMHSDKPDYPLCRVWYQGVKGNISDKAITEISASIGVQIETVLAKDDNGNSIDAPLYSLVDTAFDALSEYKLPGKGSQQFIVMDSPGLQEFQADSGPAAYLMTVIARVVPGYFTLT